MACAAAYGGTATPTTSGPIGDGEKAGLELVQKLILMAPEENSSAKGVLKIRDRNGNTTDVPVACEIRLKNASEGDAKAWEVTYTAHPGAPTGRAGQAEPAGSPGSDRVEKLTIVHTPNRPNEYLYTKAGATEPQKLAGAQAMIPFAGSDFWLADLGLEFLRWPKQRLLKTEMRKGRWCNVLQSDNPSKSPNGYSRVISWLDKESGGPILAEGYDRTGKLIKEFSIRSLKKVEGVYQLEEMQISSEQTKSRTRLEFDLDKPRPNATK